MSSNSLIYDEDFIKANYNSNKSILDYTIFDNKFYHDDKCRMVYNDQGLPPSPEDLNNNNLSNFVERKIPLIGGIHVSHIKSNLVDLESDLKGITRKLEGCSQQLFNSGCHLDTNNCKPKNIKFKEQTKGGERYVTIDTNMRNVKVCPKNFNK